MEEHRVVDDTEGGVSQDAVQEWFEGVFSKRLKGNGKVVVVMSRLHEEDSAVDVNTDGWDFPMLSLPLE